MALHWARLAGTAGACALLASAVASSAPAQEPDAVAPKRGIEEIVVTAEKRETYLQDTPLAISAFSGEELDSAGAIEIEDLTFSVPNFHFGRNIGGPTAAGGITIRGVSSAGGDRSTAFHVDGVYINSASAPEVLTFFDVQRVEVLRGPQGTLYGRNATGGAINVISNPPTDEFEASADVQLGNYDKIRSRAVLNAPFVGDRLLARLSLVQEDRDGFQRNLNSDRRAHDADDARDFGARLQGLLRVTDDIDLTVRGTYAHRGGVGFANKILGDYPTEIYLDPDVEDPLDLYAANGASPNPADKREARLDHIGNRDENQWGVNTELDWALPEIPWLGPANLTALFSYSTRNDMRDLDSDLSDIPLLVISFDDEVREIVSEVRIASAGDSKLEWLAGIFFLDSTEDLTISGRSLPFSATIPALELTTTQVTERDDQSVAIFGQATYSILDSLRITGGLRYSYDRKKASFVQPPVFLFPGDEDAFIPGSSAADSKNWDAVTGKIALDWEVRDENLLYVSVSRGYKAGVINTAPELDGDGEPIDGSAIPPVDPEFIWAYEAGSKNRFFDDRLQLNLTGFYYDYDDLQVTVVVENAFVTQSAAAATIWGFEAELVSRPWRELTLIANGAYLNAKYDDFIGFREEDPSREPVDFSGNDLTRAPRYTFNVAAQYDFDIGRWGVLSPRAQFYASDDVYFRSANDPSDKQDNYTKTDLRLSWRSQDGDFWVDAFVDNLGDVDVIQSQIVGSSLIGWPLTTALDEPRTYGVRLGCRFD